MIHNHAEYFGIPASWNYMEVGQGRVHVILLEVLPKRMLIWEPQNKKHSFMTQKIFKRGLRILIQPSIIIVFSLQMFTREAKKEIFNQCLK